MGVVLSYTVWPDFVTVQFFSDCCKWNHFSTNVMLWSCLILQLLNTSKSPLTALVVLKKICDHPRLMSNKVCHSLGLFTPQEYVLRVYTCRECIRAASVYVPRVYTCRECIRTHCMCAYCMCTYCIGTYCIQSPCQLR